MGLIVDTNVLIELERRRLSLGHLSRGLPSEPLALCAIVASELLAGVVRADSEARRMQRRVYVETILDLFPVLPFDLAAGRVYAEVWQGLSAGGVSVGVHDLLIGAIALANGYGVLTYNGKDFTRIPGLRLLEPTLE